VPYNTLTFSGSSVLIVEFFYEYGLFAAKVVTFIGLIVLGIGFILSISASRSSNKDRETLEIENINDKLEDLKSIIEAEILTKDELKALAKERKKQDKIDAKERKKRLKQGDDEPLKPRLFIIRFDGDMHASEVENLRESITTILSVAKAPDEVLVIVESAGGVVHNYGLAASQLVRIKQQQIKLTIAVDLIAASGGYMMACVADHIIAAPFALLGSVGVLAEVPNFNRFLKRFDIDIEHHTAGEYKSTLTMLGKNTSKAREKFQEELEEIHVLFKKFVAQNRPQLDIGKISTGEAWYGSQALELKLIDQIQTSDDYIIEKSANSDVYEVSFQVNESLKDKLTALLYKSTSMALEKLWYKFALKHNYTR
jgi:serine protease SohB